ncbi:MAG: TRAP transporter small permease subunit, partial [Pseudomonadota bacterium]
GVITAAVVLLRYGFNAGAIALQESVLYLHATAFMLGIASTLKDGGHVRVDVMYSRLGPRAQAAIDLMGHCLFLLPVAGTIFWLSLPYVQASWAILEGSPEVGGIPGIFLLKSLIPLMALLLAVQGLAEILKAAKILRQGDADS